MKICTCLFASDALYDGREREREKELDMFTMGSAFWEKIYKHVLLLLLLLCSAVVISHMHNGTVCAQSQSLLNQNSCK